MHVFFLCYLILLFRELNQRQRAILEEFANEEINNEKNASPEGNW